MPAPSGPYAELAPPNGNKKKQKDNFRKLKIINKAFSPAANVHNANRRKKIKVKQNKSRSMVYKQKINK